MSLSPKITNFLFELLAGLGSIGPGSVSNEDRKQALLELADLINEDQLKAKPDPDPDQTYRVEYPWDKKVAMIKFVREITQLGLKEAKDLVESGGTSSNGYYWFTWMLKKSQWTQLDTVSPPIGVKIIKINLILPVPETEVLVERTCYLVVEEGSKTVWQYMKSPGTEEGKVAVEVTLRVPQTLFHNKHLRATIDLPHEKLGEEALVDLKTAIGMSYGGKVQINVEPVMKSQLED